MALLLHTKHRLAEGSADHLHPLGTANDNSTNPEFNAKLYAWMGLRGMVLDIGCAGGGFVEACNRDGYLAIGIDGSDYSQKSRREAWGRIPGMLFTADAAQPFDITDNGRRAAFDAITAWEVMEHIAVADLPAFMENVRGHISCQGRFICSIATFESPPHHITVRDKAGWMETFRELGWQNDDTLVGYFGSDWIRGTGDEGDRRFHLCLKPCG